jgi:hypothetical protein
MEQREKGEGKETEKGLKEEGILDRDPKEQAKERGKEGGGGEEYGTGRG